MARSQRGRRHGWEAGEPACVLPDGGDRDRCHEDASEAGDARVGPGGLAGRIVRVPRPVARGGEGEGRGLAGVWIRGVDGFTSVEENYGDISTRPISTYQA